MIPVFIIAEAGVNHNGDISIAKEMVRVASKSGADAIKFQTYKTAKLVSKNAEKATYQKKNSDELETQYELLQKLELKEESYSDLMRLAKQENIEFLSSPFDMESIDFLYHLGIEYFKIPSGEITNLPYLVKIGGLQKKVILSTGMSTISEIKNALEILVAEGTSKKDITVLHANTEYPTPFKDANLKAMITIRNAFNVSIGYSDHTPGIEASIAAVALGARIIEKHFTLDKNMEGPDHKASLEPDELVQMISSIRNIQYALGDGVKKPSPSEIQNILVVRKSIHYARDLKCGHKISMKDLQMKRPGDGISPMDANKLLDHLLKKDVLSDTQANWEDII